MNDIDKFKVSFTLSLLLNEIFETLFSSINQYVLVRNVVNDKKIYSDFNREEIVKRLKAFRLEQSGMKKSNHTISLQMLRWKTSLTKIHRRKKN